MKRKFVIVIVVFLLINRKVNGQYYNSDTSTNCLTILTQVSYYWKNDSTASNGFRMAVYKRLLNSRIGKVSKDQIIDNLGKPNKVENTNKGLFIYYYYYDTKNLTHIKGEPSIVSWIFFVIPNNTNYLGAIDEGHGDYN